MYCIFAGKIRTNWNINAICSFSKPMSCKMNRNLASSPIAFARTTLNTLNFICACSYRYSKSFKFMPSKMLWNISCYILFSDCSTRIIRQPSDGRWNHCLGTPTVSHFLHAVFLESEVFLTFCSGKSAEDVLNGKLAEIWSILKLRRHHEKFGRTDI